MRMVVRHDAESRSIGISGGGKRRAVVIRTHGMHVVRHAGHSRNHAVDAHRPLCVVGAGTSGTSGWSIAVGDMYVLDVGRRRRRIRMHRGSGRERKDRRKFAHRIRGLSHWIVWIVQRRVWGLDRSRGMVEAIVAFEAVTRVMSQMGRFTLPFSRFGRQGR